MATFRAPHESRDETITAADRLTNLVLEVFRINGDLVAAGNALTEGTRLTTARWQVLGAVALSETTQTVADIARTMGLTRQAVQRVVDELEAEEFVRRVDHPHSRRARPVELTKRGQTLYAEIMGRQRPWARRLSSGISERQLQITSEVLVELRRRLELDGE